MSKLTDEQIEAIYKQETGALIDDSPWALVDFSRAIEAAATEPLLQRIAELERIKAEQPRNQCGEVCERDKLCATCARGIDGAEKQELPIAIVVNAYDTPGLQWLCQDPPSRGTRLFLQRPSTLMTRRIHPLDVPLEVFLADLTTRSANVIRSEMQGLFDGEPLTVRHLCMFDRKEMKRWPNFGKKCLNEVEELLRARGLQLWENHDDRSLRLLREHKEYF